MNTERKNRPGLNYIGIAPGGTLNDAITVTPHSRGD